MNAFFLLLVLLLSPGDDPYDHIRIGEKHLKDKNPVKAQESFERALMHQPRSQAILQKIMDLNREDGDALAFWAYMGSQDQFLKDHPMLSKIISARHKAVQELKGFAEKKTNERLKNPDELLLALWAHKLATELSKETHRVSLNIPSLFHSQVFKGLEQVMKSNLGKGRIDLAMEAARCLHGFSVQGGFKDLKGKRPRGMGALRRTAAQGLQKARNLQRKKAEAPFTVEDLEWFTQEESEAFTRKHSSFGDPGVAVSPNERYRVETDCGAQTLLGVARTVELHHNRLKNWFGQDPFLNRQGIVRIVPEAWGLEAEGAPFWWAGGFQGGDTTVLRLSCGNIEALGRGLTHELTHRFDGAVYPGMPGWLVEGRAVWTGSAYGASTDETFVPNHANFGTMTHTLTKGYGGIKKLTQLIEGKNEDYRDNYVAGYSLYLYLSTWEEDGKRIFEAPLKRFMIGCGKGKNKKPKSWFIQCFADDKEGRPEDLKAFVASFKAFLNGFFWKTRQPWTKRYTQATPPSKPSPYVYDAPTWTWSRVRCEPYFGQGLAQTAGQILKRAGRTKEAVFAFVWALSADGDPPQALAELSPLLKKLNRKSSQWAADFLGVFPKSLKRKAPFLTGLRLTRIYFNLLDQTVGAYQEMGYNRTAGALDGDRMRLASWLGEDIRVLASQTPGISNPPKHAGLLGWEEAGLTGYEEFRRANLWYVSENGDLHIGRKKPRKNTGYMDRASHFHHVFAKNRCSLLPGAYRIKMRIKFTTSYVNGAVVLGWNRRDLNLRFDFSAGDLMYAIGESEEAPAFESMNWGFNGLRSRDSALAGSLPKGSFDFKTPRAAFNLELLVDGSTIQGFINGTRVGAYHTANGAAIEGELGFAASHGAYVVQQPVIQALNREKLINAKIPLGLDLSISSSRPFDELMNLPFEGLPKSSNGAIVAWIPMPWLSPGDAFDPEYVMDQARVAAKKVRVIMDRTLCPIPFVLVIPSELGEQRVNALKEQIPETVETHPFPASKGTLDPVTPDKNRRWIFYVDSANIIRMAHSLAGVMHQRDFEDALAHWLTVFRDNGWPKRELPEIKRFKESEEEDE